MIDLSLNEAASMVKKAARGAGFSWGMANEAAFAVIWLERHEVQGFSALAMLCKALQKPEHIDILTGADQGRRKIWKPSENKVLSALTAGVYLADNPKILTSLATLQIEAVIAPVLLLPFLSYAACRLETPFVMHCNNAVLGEASEKGAWLCLDDPPEFANVEISHKAGEMAQHFMPAQRVKITPELWEVLNVYAGKTYAPATKVSRHSGAGEAV